MTKLNDHETPEESIQTSFDEGNNYPIDVWYLISEHISPEQVGVFARICTKTYLVTQSAQFWSKLYKRYFVYKSSIPTSLLPHNIKDKYGLRTHVIRALHYMYFPQKIEIVMNKADPHTLVNRRCTAMWHTVNASGHTFYFKLQDCNLPKNNTVLQRLNRYDYESDELVKNITYNNENGCKTLKVCCLHGNLIPQVEGLILQNVVRSLSRGFSHHRLLLNFGTSYIPKTPTHTVILNAVYHIEVIDWWEVNYPYQEIKRESKIELPPTIDSWELL